LEGKVIAMAPAESTAQMFSVLLAAAGVDPAKVSILSPATGAKSAHVSPEAGRCDHRRYLLSSATPRTRQGPGSLFHLRRPRRDGPRRRRGANTEWLAANPDLAKRFIKATQRPSSPLRRIRAAAIDALIRQRPEQARNRDVLIRQLQISMESVATPNTTGMPFGKMSERDWQTMVDQLVKSKQIPEAIPIERLFSNEHVPG
jgi:NitT/TauT family transport system substrate-binding protein